MIRATAISLVDQGLLSALNFLLALVLIRLATQEDYGLYSQLIGLQALFSVLHAGLFVSAYLAMLPRLNDGARREYQAGMARAELAVTSFSAVFVAVSTWLVSAWLGHPLSFMISAAAAFAVLALWWREFTRARYFAESGVWRVLRLDIGYAVLLLSLLGAIIASHAVTAAAVLWSLGIAGAVISALPLLRQARLVSVGTRSMTAQLSDSWRFARWEVLTSLVTWSHAQTFVFFAALQGGLAAAAEISAARLLTAPLALVWLSYSSILRPEASRLLDTADAHASLSRLAWRSAMFVLSLASIYALALWLAMPMLDSMLFAGNFREVGTLSFLWLAYFALTGMTTIATSLLRSAFEFKALFVLHTSCALVALAAFCAGLAFHTPAAFVIALTVVEALLAALAWRLLRRKLDQRATGPRFPSPVEALAR